MLIDDNTLVVHIGIGKTATTAIQEVGINLYQTSPESFCMLPFGIIGNANNGFSSNHPLFKRADLRELMRDAACFIKQRGKSAFLSSEFLIRQEVSDTEAMVSEFLANDINVRIFACVRNYPDLLLSSYLQAIKANYGKLDNESLNEYINRELVDARYPKMLSSWAKSAGPDNILLFDYDKHKTSFVNLFFEALGVDVSRSPLLRDGVNPSLALESIDIINEFDRVCCDKAAREVLIQLLLSKISYKPGAADHYRYLAESICANLYRDDMEILRRSYEFYEPIDNQIVFGALSLSESGTTY